MSHIFNSYYERAPTMLKKCFAIIVGVMLATTMFASDVTLLKNPYGITSLYLQSENYSPPMAHPDHSIETINIDNHAQQIVNFSDLFTDSKKALQIIANYSHAYFLKKLQAENLPKENFNLRENMIRSGTAEKLENYHHWVVVSGYLRIIFDRAQIAPSYYGEQTVDVPLSLLASVLNKKLFPHVFQLEVGDLLFQDLACGELCDGINSTTYGYKNTSVSHVGMIVSLDPQVVVIEAVSAGVKLTPLNEFLVRSEDGKNHPRTMVGRINQGAQFLIPRAIKSAMSYLNMPYNATFSPTDKAFYCSQLITQSFFVANNHVNVFALHPMNFKLSNSDKFSPAWVKYFSALKQPIPQGQLGNNPGMLSRDPHINVVYFYGELRKENHDANIK